MKCDELKIYVMPLKTNIFGKTTVGQAYYSKSDVDAAIAELKQKLEDTKATAYAESVDAGMENRRLKRALWLARAEMARTSAWVFWDRKDDYNYNKWKNVERKCRAKAEEYK